MSRKPATIISDAGRSPAATQTGDWHDFSGHHRYYGLSLIHISEPTRP